jgi:hypothetical protein
MKDETAILAPSPSENMERSAAIPHAQSDICKRRRGEDPKTGRVASRLRRMPPAAIAAITIFK